MREIYENNWSPFLPSWYEQAFDKYISTDDQLFNQDEIIRMGFNIPDADGSRSSVFRNNAVLNNSFSESKLRDVLKDIYINQSSKLRAMNHDSVNYYHYNTSFNEIKIDESNYMGIIKLDTETFIPQKSRNNFKLSQFDNQWIHINDLMNNNVFDWTFLLFINKRIYSDYQIKITEQEMLIRFKYEKFWFKNNYSIDIYKFSTNFKKRIKATKFLFMNEWNYKIPINYIDEKFNYDKAIITFNRNTVNRQDGVEDVDILGENLEFISIEDGLMDLTKLSRFNKHLIESEDKDFIWMNIIIPKYFNEYPILLPTETIYREFHPNLISVYTTHLGAFSKVKDIDKNQVYIDLDEYTPNENELWKTMIRPIVLSDAYNSKSDDMYEIMDEYVSKLRQLTVRLADVIEEFRFYIKSNKNNEEFLKYCDKIELICKDVKSAYDEFRIYLRLPIDEEYENQHKEFLSDILDEIRINKYSSPLLSNREGSPNNFFAFISPLVHIPRKLADRYYLSEIIRSMDKKILWNDYEKYKDKLRFTRPVDVSDFMFFEYIPEKESWYPCNLKVEYHFPDVYILSDPNNNIDNRIFKAFIFYSDSVNVRKESVDIIKPSTYDIDMENYEYNKEGIFRNIFMEKFYWLAIKTIYNGSLRTESRWELIEYIINNPTYKRFNKLFIHTMDPYFKMGMANYLKNENFLFTFDYMINKMNESIKNQMMNYDRITNYQMYLNKTWSPSYFDYILNIPTDWDYKDKLIRRPPISFDINRLLKILKEIESNVSTNSKRIKLNLQFVLNQLKKESYNLDNDSYPITKEEFLNYTNINLDEEKDLSNVFKSKEIFETLFDIKDEIFINSISGVKNLDYLMDKIILFNSNLNNFILEFDLDIYSIEDTKKVLSSIEWYSDAMDNFKRIMQIVYDDVNKKSQYELKRNSLIQIRDYFDHNVKLYFDKLSDMIQTFDMDNFMKVTNDLDTLKNSFKINENDISLIGEINKFDNTQADDNIKEVRNKLFVSTTQLNALFKTEKSYSKEELIEFENKVLEVKSHLQELRLVLNEFWKNKTKDKNIVDKLDNSEFLINKLNNYIQKYMSIYRDMDKNINNLNDMISNINSLSISDTEKSFINNIDNDIKSIVSSLSYINGINKKDIALNFYNEFINKINSWNDFIQIEEEVFTKIIDSTKLPSEFTNLIEEYTNLISVIKKCLNHLGDFKPDKTLPNLIDIYQPISFELSNSGFRNKLGNIVYAPNLGSFRLTKLDDDVKGATEFRHLNYRNTMFRNPLTQTLPYFSITNGDGLDVKFIPTEVKIIPIVNDKVLEKYLTVSSGVVTLVRESLPILNYANNNILSNAIDRIDKLKEEWNELKSFYNNHMTDQKIQVDILMELIVKLKDPINEYMDDRFNINIYQLLNNFESFIMASYKYHRERNLLNGNYFFYDDQVRISFNTLFAFYSSPDKWTNSSRLINLIDDSKVKLNRFNTNILSKINDDKLNELYNNLQSYSESILNYIKGLNQKRRRLRVELFNIENLIKKVSKDFYKDEWHRIVRVNISAGGEGYTQGDILEIIPELPMDLQGNIIRDQEDLIMNDVILFQVTRVNENGAVLRVKPFMDYAIPYKIYGTRETSSRISKAKGCILNIKTEIVNFNKSYLFQDHPEDMIQVDQFNDTDLFKFKFENIHDLAIHYEVFFAGIQTDDFIFRHLKDEDDKDNPNNHLHSSNYDAIYIKANDLMELKSSSIHIKPDHYLRYKVENVDIIDPGAGYAVGQDIYVDTGKMMIKLKVKELDDTPFKGIKSIDLDSVVSTFDRIDPSCERGEVITDTMNNIDDEYNDSYYDSLPDEGIEKQLMFSEPMSKYSFIAKRFDKLKQFRNSYYMSYFDINKTDTNGDPDHNYYLGTRIDENKKWNGIMNVIPTHSYRDGVLSPPNSPINGEYQNIKRERIHNSSEDVIIKELSAIPIPTIEDIVRRMDEDYKARKNDDLVLFKTKIVRIDESAIYSVMRNIRQARRSSIISNRLNDELITIQPISEDRITGIINGTILPTSTDSIRFSESNTISTNVNEIFEFTLKNAAMITPDLKVKKYKDLPKHFNDWPQAQVGKMVVVEQDENYDNHRMIYRLRSMISSGYFVYDKPEVADMKWNSFKINWMSNDAYHDLPSLNTQYPNDLWKNSKTFIGIERMINDGRIERVVRPILNKTSYIHDIRMEDLSVYNYTTQQWEDLQNYSKWRLKTFNDTNNKKWGFELSYIGNEEAYSYDMALFLNKTSKTQMKNSKLKRNAILSIKASMLDEIEIKANTISINTGRHLRIRKLFPYEQKNSFILNDNNYNMDIKINNYLHFRNELHLEDIKIFNKTLNRYEDIFDNKLFEVQFKSTKFNSVEKNTKIIRSMISDVGNGFYDGTVWGWNPEYNLYLFGEIITDKKFGTISRFIPKNCYNPPKDDRTLEFFLYQHDLQTEKEMGRVLVEFNTTTEEVLSDGYIHNVSNRLAPLPREFRIICKYDLLIDTEYEVIISKTPKVYSFIENRWRMVPTFIIENENISFDRIYATVQGKGRFPLINPATLRPTLNVKETENGTEVTFLNLYRKNEKFEIHVTPYPMRSVYTQRRVPSHGYLNLKGKLNKPLDKKYFEFWMNGRLLDKEVSIITPTKLILHGLKSLRNFEIIEINRDSNEYFSDMFLNKSNNSLRPQWDLNTYLDDVLEGNLKDDNYRKYEKEALLHPIWKQVEKDHPEYKNYPPNSDLEPDILQRIYEEDLPLDNDLPSPSYQFLITDIPTINGNPLSSRSLTFDNLGFKPMTEEEIMLLLNEEWKDEIDKGLIHEHSTIADDAWYGMLVKMYDENGNEVNRLTEAVYKIFDTNIIKINTVDKISRIIKNKNIIDLD